MDLVLGIVELQKKDLARPCGGSSTEQSCHMFWNELLDVVSTGNHSYRVAKHLLNRVWNVMYNRMIKTFNL